MGTDGAITKIYIDTDKLELNNRKAYNVIAKMEGTGEFAFLRGNDPFQDDRFVECSIFATNIVDHAKFIAETYPDKTVYLIEHPLNHGYKSDHSNLKVVWCWDDFYFFVCVSP